MPSKMRSALASAAAAWLLLLGTASSMLCYGQDPSGAIHYTDGSSLLRISGGGGQPYWVPDAPSPSIRPTDLKYGGTHRYFTYTVVGSATGTNRTFNYGDFYLWDEADGARIKVTNFRGLGDLYVPTNYTRTRWSNDRNDTFFGFFVYNSVLDETYLVRPRVSLAVPNWGHVIIVMDGQDFVPFHEGDLDPFNPDARLEVVATWPGLGKSYLWMPDGGSILYQDSYQLNGVSKTQIKLHAAGTPMGQDIVLMDEAVTGINCDAGEIDVSPDGARILFRGVTRKVDKRGNVTPTDPMGIISLDLATTNWIWLLVDTTSRSGRDSHAQPVFTADGSAFCFTAARISSGKVAGRGIYKGSLLGDGTVLLLREEASNWSPTLRRWTR